MQSVGLQRPDEFREDSLFVIHSSSPNRSGAYYAANGIQCSMSRCGNGWDNAAIESFFSSLKAERMSRAYYRTRNEAKADAFAYIECFYNPRRRHSTLGYLSPVAYEKLHKA